VFKPNPNRQLDKSTPMSLCTRNSYLTNRFPRFSQPSTSYNPPAIQNFISEELYNTEIQQVNNMEEQFTGAVSDQYAHFYDEETGQYSVDETSNDTEFNQNTCKIDNKLQIQIF